MEGGIAVLLLLIIFGVAAVIGIAMYFTGGALWWSRTGRAGDTLRRRRRFRTLRAAEAQEGHE